MSISCSIVLNSSALANCPKERITLPSSSLVIVPSPSLSNSLKASRNSVEKKKKKIVWVTPFRFFSRNNWNYFNFPMSLRKFHSCTIECIKYSNIYHHIVVIYDAIFENFSILFLLIIWNLCALDNFKFFTFIILVTTVTSSVCSLWNHLFLMRSWLLTGRLTDYKGGR